MFTDLSSTIDAINTLNTNATLILSSSTYSWYPIKASNYPPNQLDDLSSEIGFDYDENDMLKKNILEIKDNVLLFRNDLVEKNHIQPFELIMKMINNKTTFNIKTTVGDVLIIKYHDVVLKKVKNMFNLSLSCSFSQLEVEYECYKVDYENIKLDITEKRKEKLIHLKL
jgi:hypothetical protein